MFEHLFVFHAWILVYGWRTAAHEWWTLVRVAATKLQLQLGAVRVAATKVYELQTFRFT